MRVTKVERIPSKYKVKSSVVFIACDKDGKLTVFTVGSVTAKYEGNDPVLAFKAALGFGKSDSVVLIGPELKVLKQQDRFCDPRAGTRPTIPKPIPTKPETTVSTTGVEPAKKPKNPKSRSRGLHKHTK